MDEQELRNLLEQLHAEIEKADTVDEKGRTLLRDLGKDINELLARSEGVKAQSLPSMMRRLEDGIERMEATQPTLAMLLSELLAALSNAGI
jgi:SMC interacting uncharacterized protein involved in chromosome segregation